MAEYFNFFSPIPAAWNLKKIRPDHSMHNYPGFNTAEYQACAISWLAGILELSCGFFVIITLLKKRSLLKMCPSSGRKEKRQRILLRSPMLLCQLRAIWRVLLYEEHPHIILGMPMMILVLQKKMLSPLSQLKNPWWKYNLCNSYLEFFCESRSRLGGFGYSELPFPYNL